MVVPLKISVLKRTKKPVHKPHHSPKRTLDHKRSKHVSSTNGIKKIRKPQLNRRGVLIHEVLAPVSPACKKKDKLLKWSRISQRRRDRM